MAHIDTAAASVKEEGSPDTVTFTIGQISDPTTESPAATVSLPNGINVVSETDMDEENEPEYSANSDSIEVGYQIGQITVYPRKVLGKGAFGIVCEGQFGGREVAVKRVLPGTNVDREVNLHMKCDAHQNIIRYFWSEKDPMGDTYLAFQLCLGTLAQYVEGKIKVTGLHSKKLLEDATKGLRHLHTLGIVHRDVKPTNILISKPESGVVKAVVSDFGFSKKLNMDQQSFSLSSRDGTLRWMAPELMGESLRATKAVDVYSMGWILYYVLSGGKLPFDGERDLEIMQSIKNGNKNLRHVGKDDTAYLLIDMMTSQIADYRPQIDSVLAHPFFWDEKKRFSFIEMASDNLQSKSCSRHVREHLEFGQLYLFGSVSPPDWGTYIRFAYPRFSPVIDYLENPPAHVSARYDMTSLSSLLRAIRNLSHHLPASPRVVQVALGGSAPKSLVSEMFLDIFPGLLDSTWLLMANEAAKQPGFKDFYDNWWQERASFINPWERTASGGLNRITITAVPTAPTAGWSQGLNQFGLESSHLQQPSPVQVQMRVAAPPTLMHSYNPYTSTHYGSQVQRMYAPPSSLVNQVEHEMAAMAAANAFALAKSRWDSNRRD